MSDDPTRSILAALPFNRHLGLEVVAAEEGAGVVRLPERPELLNHIGTQHAGALFTAGEAASGAAVLGAFADLLSTAVPLARNAHIDYRKPARGPITATASLGEPKGAVLERFHRDGKTNFDVVVNLADGAGVTVAEMRVTWHLRRNA